MHSSISYFQYASKILLSSFLNHVTCEESTPRHTLGQLTLYQYNTCPFCCKVRTYLDARNIPYETVEVDPVFKRQMKFSSYNKVPLLMINGNRQIGDSSLIISVLESLRVSGKPIDTIMSYFPTVTSQQGKSVVKEIMNKFVVAYGNADNLDARREEAKWREWVDETYVHKFPVNIYRSPREALLAFEYIMRVEGFTSTQKFLGKYIGAVSMYFVAKRLIKRHHIEGDVRESIYKDSRKWMKAIGDNRPFLGGSEPNLADMSVYGVITSIEGLDTFKDMMAHDVALEKWYKNVKSFVYSK
ncbi:Prostaglandin E synthase 2 [Oopsacas minuta]|uniref:Prostaglandin E synthase 2 n=1 Tax=Oopsacas minuta TaxID=111878 RepID=A0AAV7K684_9METZ|nr:Prostaglandin E synthase 2 [Oopsacas minuta]